MERINKATRFFKALSVALMLVGVNSNSWALGPDANPDNLHEFEFPELSLSAEDIADVIKAERLEQNTDLLQQVYNQTELSRPVFGAIDEGNIGDKIDIEIYQNSKIVGKQFLIARQNGIIRYVFAVSAGGHGKITPSGAFPIQKQRWRHMSTLYPSQGENNMDHASYFAPAIAFQALLKNLWVNFS